MDNALKNIYAEGELSELATAEYFSVAQPEGTRLVRRKLFDREAKNMLQKGGHNDD